MIRALERVGEFAMLAIAALLCFTGPATAQSITYSYTITDLGTLGGLVLCRYSIDG